MIKFKPFIIALTLLLIVNLIKGQAPVYIDNFKPYVEKVIIESGAGHQIYVEDWKLDPANQNKLLFSGTCMNAAANGVNDVSIIITMSEAMANATITIAGIAPADINFGKDGSDNQWKAVIAAGVINALKTPGTTTVHAITIDGHDLAGNSIQGFASNQNEIPLADLNTRDNTGNWTPGTALLPDTRHYLKIGSPFKIWTDCLLPDFTASTTTVTDYETVTFTNNSFGACTEWFWEFEKGTPASYIGEIPPPISYVEGVDGESYKVSLTMSDGTTSQTTTKDDYITVTKSQASYAELDFTYNPTTAELKCVSDTDISDWVWNINSSSLSGETVTYAAGSSLPSFSVTLTVSFTADNTTKSITKVIYNCGFNR